MKVVRGSIKLTKGSSYYGSGGYSAGWRLKEGEIEATPIADSFRDNGFVQRQDYLIRPVGGSATIEVWNGDGISSSGYRRLGSEGLILLVPEDSDPPKICPDCGHILNV